MVSTALVSHIAVTKYAWQSTLYRQARILAGQGVEIDRQTLARWMRQTAWMLKGLYDLQLTVMHGYPRLFCDETPMPVLDPGRGRTKTCQFWAHATDDRHWLGPAPPAVAYVFAESRGKKEIASQLSTFKGVLQVDGYAAYKALVGDHRTKDRISLAFCLTHARRKFVAVFKSTRSPFAKEVIETISAVYAIEKRIRGTSADERRAVRQAETRPIMEALHAKLSEVQGGLSQISPLTKAIGYMLDHWVGLTRFLADGRLEPDTNIVERPIRPIAIGRRNSLFAGDEGGGATWAVLSTLLNTALCRARHRAVYADRRTMPSGSGMARRCDAGIGHRVYGRLGSIRHSLTAQSASRKASRRSFGWKRVGLPRSYGVSFARAASLRARCACR
jgi:transposase